MSRFVIPTKSYAHVHIVIIAAYVGEQFLRRPLPINTTQVIGAALWIDKFNSKLRRFIRINLADEPRNTGHPVQQGRVPLNAALWRG